MLKTAFLYGNKRFSFFFLESGQSPKLTPYPNWESHSPLSNDTSKIISPFRVRADQCGRLWVLDTGVENILGNYTVLSPTKLLVYNLQNDALLRSFVLPKEQRHTDSFFANIAVEDHDCNDTFAYLADLGKPGIVVYSWKDHTSHRVVHNFFHMDPLAGEFKVSNISFEWSDGIFGLALSGPDAEGYSTLYFHPFVSTAEFSVNTKFLRKALPQQELYYHFKQLGSRGTKGQSGASFLDKKTKVLFYALVNLNAIACWKTTNPAYTMVSQGRVYMSNVTMVFPNDIKVDNKDNLWVLSNRLAEFMYKSEGLNDNEINFRILKASVADAIRGTACDSILMVPKSNPGAGDEPSGQDIIRNSGFVAILIICTAILNL